ncbi:MAG: hypothetical protein LBD55_00120 [Treponema sp.]|jgi:hypothetical protein|nr:hypothetical protein [Treponema sp.]
MAEDGRQIGEEIAAGAAGAAEVVALQATGALFQKKDNDWVKIFTQIVGVVFDIVDCVCTTLDDSTRDGSFRDRLYMAAYFVETSFIDVLTAFLRSGASPVAPNIKLGGLKSEITLTSDKLLSTQIQLTEVESITNTVTGLMYTGLILTQLGPLAKAGINFANTWIGAGKQAEAVKAEEYL